MLRNFICEVKSIQFFVVTHLIAHVLNFPLYFVNYICVCRYIEVSTGPGQHFVFAIERSSQVRPNDIGFSLLQRKWGTLSINQDIMVKQFTFNMQSKTEYVLTNVVLEVDFLQKKT